MSDQPDDRVHDWPKILAYICGAFLLGLTLGSAIPPEPGKAPLDPSSRAFLLLTLCTIFGAFVTAVLFWMAGKQAQGMWYYVPVFCTVVLAIAAAQADQMSFVQASLTVVFGSVALSAAAAALASFRKGEAIELQSNWGGLGGGLGGWRMSSATSLAVLAFLFAIGAAVVVQPRNPPAADGKGSDASDSKVSKGAKAGAVAQPLGRAAPSPAAAPPPPGGENLPQGQRTQ